MPSAVSTAKKHVPAWKKLGLKLKNAKDEPAIVDGDQASPTNKKREIAIEDHSEQIAKALPSEKLIKKSKASASSSSKPAVTVVPNTASPAVAHPENPNSTSTPKKVSASKRKSVSFALHTKTEDADSNKDLYDNWLSSELTSDPSFDPSKIASPALKSITPSSVAEPTGNLERISTKTPKKRSKKSKSTTLVHPFKPSSDANPIAEPSNSNKATLDYLLTYYSNRPAWKFSKIRQTQLLRSLFPPPPRNPSSATTVTTSQIPSSHLPALHAYLSGLQGRSVRQRLRAQALAVREDDEKPLADAEGDMEAVQSIEKRREEYLKEVERVKALLEGVEDQRAEQDMIRDTEWWDKVHRRRIAELVLWSVGEGDLPGEGNRTKEEATKTNEGSAVGGQGVKRPLGKNGRPKRKRKRRTTGVPDDESSSSSGSSSDSEDSKKGEGEKRGVVAERAKPKDGGSSSSGSNSESNSENSSSDGESGSSGSGGSGSGDDSDSESGSGSDG